MRTCKYLYIHIMTLKRKKDNKDNKLKCHTMLPMKKLRNTVRVILRVENAIVKKENYRLSIISIYARQLVHLCSLKNLEYLVIHYQLAKTTNGRLDWQQCQHRWRDVHESDDSPRC